MQQVKKTADYTIYEKKSGRYAIKGKDKQWLHGEDKTRILTAEQLVKLPEPKAAVPESAPEAAPEAVTEATPEATAEGQPES